MCDLTVVSCVLISEFSLAATAIPLTPLVEEANMHNKCFVLFLICSRMICFVQALR